MNPLLPIEHLLFLTVIAVGAITWFAWRASREMSRIGRVAVVLLRGLAAMLLLLPLYNPGEWVQEDETAEEEWVALLDRSASMGVADVENRSRREAAGIQAAELAKAAQDREATLRWAGFAGKLEAAESPEQIGPIAGPEEATDLLGALDAMLDRYPAGGPRLSGVVIFSDGRQVAGGSVSLRDTVQKARAMRTRVHGVLLGGPVKLPELEITSLRRQFTGFRGQSIPVRLRVGATATGPVQVPVEVKDEKGKTVFNQALALKDGDKIDLRVPLEQLGTGYHRFVATVGSVPGENLTANNRVEFSVHVLSEAVRILLVEGSPYWDSKFITQLLERQENYELNVVYRLADQKFFSLRAEAGKPGEAATVPTALDRATFPATAEELAGYDLIIFGQSVEYFIDAAQAGLLREWVERGGSLILARGRPVAVDMPALTPLFPMTWEIPWQGSFQWKPAHAGEEAGLFGGDLPGRNDPLWAKLPPLQEAVYGATLAPFTQVLVDGVAKQGEREQRFPLVVSRRVGEGVVLAVNARDMWRWDFMPEVPLARDFYRDFWLQTIHWAVAFSEFMPGFDYAMRVSHRSIEVGKPLRVRVLRRQGVEAAKEPKVHLRRDGKVVRTLEPTPLPERGNAWESVLSLSEAGSYVLELDSGEGEEDGGKRLFEILAVTVPPGEMDQLSAEGDLLESLGKSTGGNILTGPEWGRVFQAEPDRAVIAAGEAEWLSSWDRVWVLLGLMGCLAGEWILRRRSGLV